MHPALEIIARIARADAGAVAPGQTLGKLGLGTSLGLSVLQSALERRFKRKLRPLAWRMTVAELLAATDGAEQTVATNLASSEGTPVRPKNPSGPFGGRTRAISPAAPVWGHGVDLQDIAAMPATDGEGATAFYEQHFTAAELAGAELRPDQRAHLCGLWCAKEAVRKSDPALLALAPREIVIESDSDGRPRVRLERSVLEAQFQIVLSISHSTAYAMASAITCRR